MTRHGTWRRRTTALAVTAASALAMSSGPARAAVSIDIKAPAAGATYEAGQPVTIAYTCTSPFTIFQCDLFGASGTLVPGTPLDTSTPGDFTVTAAVGDTEPSDGEFRYRYTVAPAVAPSVVLTTPADGARYSALRTLFTPVRVSYSCSDSGSGIASCTASQPDGARLNTGFTALGRRSFTVTARDRAGLVTTVTHTYTVTLL
jgi:hypothetical protein